MRRMTQLIMLVAFIFSCGGQWCVLQGIAWANMIREYSATVPLGEAVKMTMSGQHLCAMCMVIAAQKKSEHRKVATLEKQEKKILAATVIVPLRTTLLALESYCVREQFFKTRSETPLSPPPRVA